LDEQSPEPFDTQSVHPDWCRGYRTSQLIKCPTDPNRNRYGKQLLIAMDPQFLGWMAIGNK
jgi:hypothetical protein